LPSFPTFTSRRLQRAKESGDGKMERRPDSVLDSANPGKTSNNGKKRYKRVMTPARKAQNRAAQKAYRESQLNSLSSSDGRAYRWLIFRM
jgi:hypothetical protein